MKTVHAKMVVHVLLWIRPNLFAVVPANTTENFAILNAIAMAMVNVLRMENVLATPDMKALHVPTVLPAMRRSMANVNVN